MRTENTLCLLVVLVCSLAYSEAAKYTDEGYEIRWVHTCVRTQIVCPYGTHVIIVEKFDGKKPYDCPKTQEGCCVLNKEIDCFQATSYAFVRFQQDLCRNKTSCDVFLPGGIRIRCGITSFVAVSYYCKYGGLTTTTTTTTQAPTTTQIATTPDDTTVTITPEVTTQQSGPVAGTTAPTTQTQLAVALGLSIGCTFILCVAILCVFYARYHRRRKERERQLIQQTTLSTLSKFQVDEPKADFPYGSSVPGTNFPIFGLAQSNALTNFKYSQMFSGNLWKPAHWMTSLDDFKVMSRANDIYSENRKAGKEKNSKYKDDDDIDSLGLAEDLETFPDISIFSIPEGRNSPDSGLDNLGYILPTIPDSKDDEKPRESPRAESPELEADMSRDEIVNGNYPRIFANDGEPIWPIRNPQQQQQQSYIYGSDSASGQIYDRLSRREFSHDSGQTPQPPGTFLAQGYNNDAYSNYSAIDNTEMLY